MPFDRELPAGLTARSLRMDDAGAVAAVMAEQELFDVGEADIEESDIVADWQRPSVDLAVTTLGIFDGDHLVAYGEIATVGHSDTAVHPAYRGRGVGTAIAEWMQDTARGLGWTRLGMPVAEGSPADALLEALGYERCWTAWNLALPAGATLRRVEVAGGYVLRAAAAAEYETCWGVVEDAFLEWADRERVPFADWRTKVAERPGFEPWKLRVAADDDDCVVGVAVMLQIGEYGETAHIDQLAVRRDRRGLGLGLGLINDAFGVASAHGATNFTLGTDSRSGALSLYERAGMAVTSTWVNREISLG